MKPGEELESRRVFGTGIDYCIAGRVLVGDVPSDGYFALAKGWLEDCVANHHACNDQLTNLPALPNRILNVTEVGQDPYLISGDRKHARYATLSHCWGGAVSAMTTKSNFHLHMEGIQLKELPRTYREAIETCRKLEIPYLWIDSLCIIQDDTDDWERESEVMGTIYFNSTLTISATAASNSTEGLFNPRKHCGQIPAEWDILVTLPLAFSDHQGQVYLTPSWFHPGYMKNWYLEVSVLQSRGWVMQERSLSHRTLHFSKSQMIWECCTEQKGLHGFHKLVDKDSNQFLVQLHRCKRALSLMRTPTNVAKNEGFHEDVGERKIVGRSPEQEKFDDHHHDSCGPEQRPPVATTPHNPNSQMLDVTNNMALPYTARHSTISTALTSDPYMEAFLSKALRWTFYYFWYETVAEYSIRSLTFAADKLPAMAGLASRVHDITEDQYLAGHWRCQLAKSLFWNRYRRAWRRAIYRAPSWSWASMDGRIGWRFLDTHEQYSEAAIKVIDAQTDVQGQNMFGRVTDGYINMQASVIRATWIKENCGWSFTGHCSSYQGDHFLFQGPDMVVRYLPIYATEEDTGEHANNKVGWWEYDDSANGVLLGPVVSGSTLDVQTRERMLLANFDEPNMSRSHPYGDKPWTKPIQERATYLPEELLLVKGPVKRGKDVGFLHPNDFPKVEVLVLAKAGEDATEYKRVGIGRLVEWDEKAETVEILKVV
jgi:hypothetical protein